MKILSIECSASPASVAIIDDGKIIASSFVNIKLTHSQTLMPMIEATLKSATLSVSDIKGISVSAGPGSFTGVRIGISIAKGLATPNNLPCVPVSTLQSMAYMFLSEDVTVCPVMDARCNQIYNALFKVKNGKVERLCEDRAILIDQLIEELKSISGKIVICGDGSDLFAGLIKDFDNIKIPSENLKYQSAVGVGLMSYDSFVNGNTVPPESLVPIYLRLPQAERELKAKNEKKD